MEEEKLKKAINLEFICCDCQKNVALCFKCKKKGKFYPELSSSKSKSKAKAQPEKEETVVSETGDEITEADSTPTHKQEKAEVNGKFNDLIKCSTANCNKFYHLNCISDNPLFKFFDANKHKKFRCALHYCAKCKISGDTMAIAQCFRCPKSYHLKCYAKDKILKITKKIIICQVIILLFLIGFIDDRIMNLKLRIPPRKRRKKKKRKKKEVVRTRKERIKTVVNSRSKRELIIPW